MNQRDSAHPYVPNSAPAVKARMLRELGLKSAEELFSEVPARLRLNRPLDLPPAILDEAAVRRHLEGLLAKNAQAGEYLCFLGAGSARHFVPAVCDEVNGRAEFLTAYTGEAYADHGKWQALFEFQSLMAELLDMDVLTGPLYDGAQAAAVALRMAARLTGRREVLLPRTMNPEVLAVIRLWAQGVTEPALVVKTVGFDPATGLLDINDLEAQLGPDTAAVFVENPTFLGLLEAGVTGIGQMARAAGAEFVVYTDPLALGVLAPPAAHGATMACGDFHPLGLHLNCGGGQAGFLATHDEPRYLGEFPEKMFGLAETTEPGEFGFGYVLFDRTLFGSREKGKDFTGTTTGLWAITAAVYLSCLGPQGLRELGRTIRQKAKYAAASISGIDGLGLAFPGPFFKEFVVNFDRTGRSVAQVNQALLEKKILGGLDLSGFFPELGQSALFCVTELMTRDDLDYLAAALAAAVA